MDISSMLEVQVNEMKVEMDVKENVTPSRDQAASTTTTAVAPISQEESAFYKLIFKDIASVRYYRIHCTACNEHIGSAPAEIHNMFEHPVLRTLLCARCREFYGDGTFEQGDDATDMFCRWCANGGNLYCCSYCSNTFCYKCIKRNFSIAVRKKIEADESWRCFVCNPRDLYSARAMCWALLQHVQTVTRILKNEKRMNAKDIEEKMNFDESQCCTRRSKRRFRRVESKSSEEEDETYVPEPPNGLPLNMKRKVRRFKLPTHFTPVKQTPPLSRMPIPIRPRPTASMSYQTFKQTELCRIEQKKQIVNPSENIIVTSPNVINTDASSLSRYSDSIMVQSPSFYHTFMNSAGSSTFLQVSSAVKPSTHQITLPSLPTQSTLYQPPQLPRLHPLPRSQSQPPPPPPPPPPPNTMVSIPNPPRKRGRPRLLLPKSKKSNLLTPNIIDLDSDSDDEPKVVEEQNDSMVDTDAVGSEKVVPIALTWENDGSDDDGMREEQPLTEVCASTEKSPLSFNEVMLSHKQELDKILYDVKERAWLFFNLPNTNKDEPSAQKIKYFCRCMRNTVLQLAHINDRVAREYDGWIKSQNTDALASVDENASQELIQENLELPLDMICVNESDTDSDYEKPEDQIKKSSDLIKSSNIMHDLLFFKKDIVHRGVGDNTILYADKGIQVCDVVPCDYEKHISHSVLNIDDYSSKTNDNSNDDNISKPLAESQENFGKYEEQFIYYLQHIEDHGIETEDAKELVDSDKIPSQELRKATSPCLSLQDIDLCIPTDEQTKNSEQKRNTENSVNSLLEDNKIDVPTNTIHKDETINELHTDIKITEKRLQETNNHPTEEDAISITSNNNDANSSQNGKTTVSIETVTSTQNEDCTIIDD